MPQYELCYLLSAQVSDDMVPEVTSEIKSTIENFGGTNVLEEHLGKKKLAYPIKKTRNGYYVVVRFAMPAKDTKAFEAKLRTNNNIIRYLLLNIEEHLERMEKDQLAQAKMNQKRGEQPRKDETKPAATAEQDEEVPTPEPETDSSDDQLEQQIEAALSAEDIIK